jgi:hypothetical protein
MNEQLTNEQRRAKDKADRERGTNEGFAGWMAKPETKLILSTIPQSQPPEAVQTLLRSAFDAGVGVGEGCIAMMMVSAMLERGPKG